MSDTPKWAAAWEDEPISENDKRVLMDAASRPNPTVERLRRILERSHPVIYRLIRLDAYCNGDHWDVTDKSVEQYEGDVEISRIGHREVGEAFGLTTYSKFSIVKTGSHFLILDDRGKPIGKLVPTECHGDLDDIIALIDSMKGVYSDPYIEWRWKFNRIFEWAPRLKEKIEKTGLPMFDWYDPDTSYQEDVTSYMHAALEFQGKVIQLKSAETRTR